MFFFRFTVGKSIMSVGKTIYFENSYLETFYQGPLTNNQLII